MHGPNLWPLACLSLRPSICSKGKQGCWVHLVGRGVEVSVTSDKNFLCFLARRLPGCSRGVAPAAAQASVGLGA